MKPAARPKFHKGPGFADCNPKGLKEGEKVFAFCVLILWAGFIFFHSFHLNVNPIRFLASAFTFSGDTNFAFNFFFRAWFRFVWMGFVVLTVVFAAWSWGRFVRKWTGLILPNRASGFAVDFSLGVLFFSILWFGLGLVNLWFKPFLGTLFVALLLFRAWKDTQFASWRPIRICFPGFGLEICLLILGFLFLAFSFLNALLPETHPDGLVYHLGAISFWLFHHGMADFPGQPLAHFPFSGELFYLPAVIFCGGEGAKLLNVAVLAATALAAAGWAKQAAGDKGQWLALGLVLTLPLLHLVAWTSQIETFQALFVILFLQGLSRLLDKPGPQGLPVWVFLSCFWGAFAMSIKYTSFFWVAAGIISFLFFCSNRRLYLKPANLAAAGITVILIFGPWMLKNWVYTGDAVYPYLAHWFSGRSMSAEGYRFMLQDQGFISFAGWHWLEFLWKPFIEKPSLFNFAGPLPLVLLPCVLVLRHKNKTLTFLALTLGLGWLMGLGASNILKFQMPGLVLFYVYSSILICLSATPFIRKALVLTAVLSALLCFPYLAGFSAVYYSGGGLWSGKENRAEYLRRVLKNPYVDLCGYIEKNLPGDSRLLVLGDARGFYYPRAFYTDTGYDYPFLSRLFQRTGDLGEIQRAVREAGFTHLVVNGLEGITEASLFKAYPLTGRQWEKLDEYVRRGWEPLFSNGWQGVFKVLDPLKEKPDLSFSDPMLFFSEPAVRFMEAKQKGDWPKAKLFLDQAVRLYPFSDDWHRLEKTGGAVSR
jgi:hypothetical protein